MRLSVYNQDTKFQVRCERPYRRDALQDMLKKISAGSGTRTFMVLECEWKSMSDVGGGRAAFVGQINFGTPLPQTCGDRNPGYWWGGWRL